MWHYLDLNQSSTRRVQSPLIAGGNPRPMGLVFTNTAGNRIKHRHMDAAIRRVLKAIGIEKRSPLHSFRHTMAMRLIDRGVSPRKVLINQMGEYFIKTHKGRERSARVITEPFFVHSDLTTAVQVADILIYILNWGYRKGAKLTKPARDEIMPLAERVGRLQYVASIEMENNSHDTKPFKVYGITYIDSLQSVADREDID